MTINRRRLLKYSIILTSTGILATCSNKDTTAFLDNSSPKSSPNSKAVLEPNRKLDKVTFGTNWYAQAEHGGFYQAVATGIYNSYGLDVTIKMGGPQVNGTQLLVGGAIDFLMSNSMEAIKAVEQEIPAVAVAAIFQKSPVVLIAHPNVGNDSLEKLKGKPIFVSAAANTTYWNFLKTNYGFTDEQKRPYNFNPAPFLVDQNSAQQGYLTSEPYTIETKGGFKPTIFLLADAGYSPYDTTIETTQKLVETNPSLVQRFVDASIKGWYDYLKNPTPANELIKKDNPDMTDELLAYGLKKLKEYGIIISGDAETKGIGVMTDKSWKKFFDSMVKDGLVKNGTPYQKAYTLKFIGNGSQVQK
ncbi:ABC transporter substrate-binding protein [Scytonema sp. NUACC26]|uniref:ABC transporter substrate-binding protein n=1 Tax=Scytonema sp. NUACC26 TaxID=3140176 RepID=UPI0034DC212C